MKFNTRNAQHGRWRLPLSMCIACAAGLIVAGGGFAQEAPAGEANRFDLSVKDMDLGELLKMVAANNRVSIVCSSDVSGKVSVNFFKVTLEEALDAILTVNGLTFERRGNIIYISKPTEEEDVVMVTRTFELAWADPQQVVNLLTDLKSEDGTVTRSGDAVIVVVRDVPQTVDQMAAVVEEIDHKPRQVHITTWVVEIGDTDIKKLGVNWASLDSLKVFEFTGEASYKRTKTNTNAGVDFTRSAGTVVDLRAGVLSDNEFSLLLSFFETLSESKVVSEPRLMTLENRPAQIVVGKIVPIPLYDFAQETGTRILSGFQEQSVGTEVLVTPRVHSDSYVTLDIAPKVEQIVDYILVNGEKQRPIVSTRRAQTTVMVKSGDIVVIGGLRDTNHTLQASRVPLLHKIPILGPLFKTKTEDNSATDLTIFIKPELFDENNPLSVEEQELIASVNTKSEAEAIENEVGEGAAVGDEPNPRDQEGEGPEEKPLEE